MGLATIDGPVMREIMGRLVDLERVSIISGRSVDRILELAGGVEKFDPPPLPEKILALDDWQSTQLKYLVTFNRGEENLALLVLFRLIELADDESKLALLAKRVLKDGSPIECVYLRRVAGLCSACACA